MLNKITKFLKELFDIEQLPNKELYILLSIFALIIALGLLKII